MRISYHAETDRLCIDLSGHPATESLEVSAGIVLGYDARGCLAEIDISNASERIQLDELVLSRLAARVRGRANGD